MLKNNMELVSIILTTFNGELYVKEQLGSIAKQSYDNWELIICDDASTDGTLRILNEFKTTYSSRVKILKNKINSGLNKNFERGLPVCKGRFVAVCDVDDFWVPSKLQKQVELMNLYPDAVMSHHDLEIVDVKLAVLSGSYRTILNVPRPQGSCEDNPLGLLINKNFITAPSIIFRRELIDKLGSFPPCFSQDYWISLVAASSSEILYLDEALVKYRQRPGNMQGAAVKGLGHHLKKMTSSQTGNDYAAQLPELKKAFTRIVSLANTISKELIVNDRLMYLTIIERILSRSSWVKILINFPTDLSRTLKLKSRYLQKSSLYFILYKLIPIKQG